MDFKVGDKVKHRITVEEMIVAEIDPQSRQGLTIGCRRYLKNENRYETHFFRKEELELVEEK